MKTEDPLIGATNGSPRGAVQYVQSPRYVGLARFNPQEICLRSIYLTGQGLQNNVLLSLNSWTFVKIADDTTLLFHRPAVRRQTTE